MFTALARGTDQRSAVAADTIGQRAVINPGDRPHGGTSVTGVTRQCGRDMQPQRFALGRRNNPMTISTRGTRGLQVIDIVYRLPHQRTQMTRLA